MKPSYEELTQRVKELEAENENLRKSLANAKRRLDALESYNSRRYQHEQDYLPYEDDDRRGD